MAEAEVRRDSATSFQGLKSLEAKAPLQKTQQQKHSEDRRRLRPVALLIIAAQRFQAALNPTYSYGKRPSAKATPALLAAAQQPSIRSCSSPSRLVSGRASSGRTESGRPLAAGYQHGYKAQLLFKPLPPCSDVAVM